MITDDVRPTKRLCYQSKINPFKRPRVCEEVVVETRQQPYLLPAGKLMYSQLEVQGLLEDVESRYIEQLEAYSAFLRDLLLPKQNTERTYCMEYISWTVYTTLSMTEKELTVLWSE